MISFLLLAILSSHGPDPMPDGEQLMRVLEGLHAEIRDFEFVCEGEVTVSNTAAEDLKKLGTRCRERTFQGVYAYRAIDGAAYLNLYEKPFEPDCEFVHMTSAQLKGKYFTIYQDGDRRDNSMPAEERKGAPGALTFPCSPERFIWLSRWRRLGYSVVGARLECEGWDQIDGTPVLRISIEHSPFADVSRRRLTRCWIDLKRGGHVLREESTLGSTLWFRLDNVRLASFRLDGNNKEVWFPVAAEF